MEDCRQVTGRLERDLLAAGERVLWVPPRLLAGARQAVRVHDKSDPIDALALARAALGRARSAPAGQDQASWEVKLLVDHREHLVAEPTRTINRLRWHRHQLDPDLEPTTRRLPGPGLERSTARLAQGDATGEAIRARNAASPQPSTNTSSRPTNHPSPQPPPPLDRGAT